MTRFEKRSLRGHLLGCGVLLAATVLIQPAIHAISPAINVSAGLVATALCVIGIPLGLLFSVGLAVTRDARWSLAMLCVVLDLFVAVIFLANVRGSILTS